MYPTNIQWSLQKTQVSTFLSQNCYGQFLGTDTLYAQGPRDEWRCRRIQVRSCKNKKTSKTAHCTICMQLKNTNPCVKNKFSVKRMFVRPETQPVDAHILMSQVRVQSMACPDQMGTLVHFLAPSQFDSYPPTHKVQNLICLH